jgi:hypothetical protein
MVDVLLQVPNDLYYYRSLHELVDVLEGRAAENNFSSASEVDEVMWVCCVGVDVGVYACACVWEVSRRSEQAQMCECV